MEKEETPIKTLSACHIIEVSAWKNKKILIIKPLIPLRIAQILWSGGAQIIIIFYSVILKHRGLNLLEMSYIFSATFLFQFATASICGVIADRIGYSKPILLFLILGTLSVIICILLAPALRNGTCAEPEMDTACYNSSEIRRRFCNACTENNGDNLISGKQNKNVLKDFNRSNALEIFNLFAKNNNTAENYSDILGTNFIDSLCFENCSILCKAFQTNKSTCFTREKILLAIYSALIICLFSFLSTGYFFFDFVALCLAAQYGSDFGKEAFIATFGELLIVAVAAFALNTDTSIEEKINYDVAYWCCAVTIAFTFISVYIIEDVKAPPGRKLKKKAWKLIRNTDTLVFITVVFVAGNGFSFNLNFHLLFLENINASKTVIALHSLSSSFYGILILLSSKWWITRFGTEMIFALSLLSYAINDIGYSFLFNPWLSLLLEVTSMFSYQLMWIALVIHSNKIAPEGLAATLNAVAGTVHYGVGRSTAIMGGGLLMNYFGARIAYRVFGCIFLVTAAFYSLFLCRSHLLVTRNSEKSGVEAEEMKHMNVTKEQEI